RDVSPSPVSHQRQHARRRNQRNQTCSLRAMLAECKQQHQQRHQQHSSANPKQSRSDPANASHRQNPRSTSELLIHANSLGPPHPRNSSRLVCATAKAPPPSESIRKIPSTPAT